MGRPYAEDPDLVALPSPQVRPGPAWQPHSGSRSFSPGQKAPWLYVPREREEPATLTRPEWLIGGPNKGPLLLTPLSLGVY